MRGSRSVHASAICASDCPRLRAISFSARIFASAWSVSRSGESDVFAAAREPAGIPSRYLSVSIPCASGEKPMQPTPSSPSVSSSSGSIHRFSSEYDGWWMSSGVPRRSRIAYASRVFSGEYDEMPA